MPTSFRSRASQIRRIEVIIYFKVGILCKSSEQKFHYRDFTERTNDENFVAQNFVTTVEENKLTFKRNRGFLFDCHWTNSVAS